MRTMNTVVASITAPLMVPSAFSLLNKGDIEEFNVDGRRSKVNRSSFMSRAACAVCLVVLLAAPAAAQINLTGDWDVTIESPQGTDTARVTLTQDGEKLSGRFKSETGELPITGALTGADLKIAFSLPIQGQWVDIVVTGKVEGPTLVGKVLLGDFGEGDWTAKRAETAASLTTSAGAPGGASGEWALTFKTPKGDVQATATINQDGGKLSGTLSNEKGKVPLTGTLEGTSLIVTSNVPTPRGIRPITMKGSIEGDAFVKGKAKVKGIGTMKWTGRKKQ